MRNYYECVQNKTEHTERASECVRFFPFSFSLYSNFTSFALLFFVAVACCYFSPNISICLHPLGVGVCVDQTNLFNLHRRSFDSIVMYNCTQGSERTAEKGSPNQSFINIFIYWINTINKTIYLLIELNYSSLVFSEWIFVIISCELCQSEETKKRGKKRKRASECSTNKNNNHTACRFEAANFQI